MTTQSQDKVQQSDPGQIIHSPKQPHPHFRVNERVVVYDDQGVGIHGTARWIEEVHYAGDKLIAVGIETVRCCCMRVHTHTYVPYSCRMLRCDQRIF